MMDRCVVCGNVGEKTFRVIAADGSSHVVERGSAIFCSDHCAREASSGAAKEATTASFRISDPPAFPTSARAIEAKTSAPDQRLRTFVESAAH